MIARLASSGWLLRWVERHPRWSGGWLVLVVLAAWIGVASPVTLAVIGGAPALVGFVWQAASPGGYERFCAGPLRRFGWCWRTRVQWKRIAERCRLCDRIPVIVRTREGRRAEQKLLVPKLRKVRSTGHRLELTIRARAGQTVEDIDEAAPRLASTLGAVSFRTRPVSGALAGCTTVVELVMDDALTTAALAIEPEDSEVDRLRLGRTQEGGDWHVQLRGRHTLVAVAPVRARARSCGVSAAGWPPPCTQTWYGSGASISSAESSWRWVRGCSRRMPTSLKAHSMCSSR